MNAKTTEEPAKNPAPDAQSTKAVSGLVSDKKDPDNDAAAIAAKKKEAEDAAIAKEVEAQAEMSAAEQKNLEKILGNGDESGDDEVPEQPEPPVHHSGIPNAMKKILKLVSLIPKETPDEHVVWGAAGVKLELGDLRELCKYVS
jgi:hypothetical protein